MKPTKEPTQGQFLGLWRTATELGLDREMVETLVPKFTVQMKELRDQILRDRDNCITIEVSAFVCQYRRYEESLRSACASNIKFDIAYKIAGAYPPTSSVEENADFILRNFPKGGGSWDRALLWAKMNSYKIANPRELFAVVEQHNLRELIGLCNYSLIATTICYHTGYGKTIKISNWVSQPRADLECVDNLGGSSDWFLFRK